MRSKLFQNQFFSQSMTQTFNSQVSRFESDERESAVRKYVRASGSM